MRTSPVTGFGRELCRSGRPGFDQGGGVLVHPVDDRPRRRGTRPRAWRPGDLRHLGGSAESCCLPALTRFTGSDRTGPDRHTPERVHGNDTLSARIPAPVGSWRDARADDSARLERVCGFTVTVGSNPTPSADRPRPPVSARL